MPFKSKAQIAKLQSMVAEGKLPQAKFDEWMSETNSPDTLPERVAPISAPGSGKPNKSLSDLVKMGRNAKVIK